MNVHTPRHAHYRPAERGTALVEAALVMPLMLLIMLGIFEIGRAYQTWQVLTNAAREGARAAVLPSGTDAVSRAVVRQYLTDGQLKSAADATIDVDREAELVVDGITVGASEVTVDYPFEFAALGPIARLLVPTSTVGDAITMQATALMRNESQ